MYLQGTSDTLNEQVLAIDPEALISVAMRFEVSSQQAGGTDGLAVLTITFLSCLQ